MKKIRVVLIIPNMMVDIDYTTKSVSRFVPDGLLYLARPLLDAGFDVRICDLSKDALTGEILEADVFGISGLPNQFPQMKDVIENVRRNAPHAKIVLGGPFITCAINWLNDLLDFDLAIVGEAENLIVTAVSEALKNNEHKKILTSRSEATGFYLPAFELIDLGWYLDGRHRLFNYLLPYPTINNAMFSRGCPMSCNFCKQPFGRKIKYLPSGNIDFILESYAKAGAKSIRFQDDNWQYLKPEIRDHALGKMSELGLKTAFNCRVSDLSEDFLKDVSQYGVVRQMSFGIESLSQKSLDTMKKGTSVDQIKRAVALCRNYNIEPAFFLMIGSPGETRESISATTQLIESENVFPLFTFFLPIPSTIYWDDFLQHHSVLESFDMFNGWDSKQVEEKKSFYNTTDVSGEELIEYSLCLKTLQDRFNTNERGKKS